jgi:hypothetical protein
MPWYVDVGKVAKGAGIRSRPVLDINGRRGRSRRLGEPMEGGGEMLTPIENKKNSYPSFRRNDS